MEFKLADWLPMSPMIGPPLPRFLGIKWPWYKPEVPANTVEVGLKNPLAEGDEWQLLIVNHSKTDSRFIEHIPMDGVATFDDIPEEWDFPLYVVLSVYQRIDSETVRQVYSVQSYWGPGSENYAEVYIEALGQYYFDFATEVFNIHSP